MSINLMKRNSSSPFHLQRSMVDQGGAGGAYEAGGYNPDAVYNNDAANAAVESLGKTIGASIAARTPEDKNKEDVKKSDRLEKRQEKLKDKKLMNSDNDHTAKRERIEKRIERVGARKEKVDTRIKDYNESEKPTVKSDITSPSAKTKSISTDDSKKSSIDLKGSTKTNYNESTEPKPKKMVEFEKKQADKEKKDKLAKAISFGF